MVKELTPAERQLVEWAALGISNRELARRRSASPSTVANQLSSAYRKLGVAGRRELRALMNGARDTPARPLRLHSLSLRERLVLERAERGQSNKLIADALGLAISTVSSLLTRGRRKL